MYYPLLLSVFTITSCFAQWTHSKPSSHRVGTVVFVSTVDRVFDDPQYEVLGSPYYNDTLSQATVFVKNGPPIKLSMRYNIYSDWMEYKKHDSIFAVGPERSIVKIKLGLKDFIIDSVEQKGKTILSYFQVLDSGKITLLAKPIVTFKERQQGKPIEGDIPAKYTRQRDMYFIKKGNSELKKISDVDDIVILFDGDQRGLQNFVREHKLGVKKRDEILAIIKYCNSN